MKFLIVDDDERILRLLAKHLEGYGDSVQAESGPEAIRAFKQAMAANQPFDAVFMDILMPEMDGHAAVQKMRELEKQMGVPGPEEFKLVMITALSDVKNVTTSFFKGYASCYIVKPFDREKVLNELIANGIIS